MTGTITDEASRRISREMRRIMPPFLSAGFDVTWAGERRAANARLFLAVLKPDDNLREAFSFHYELLLAYSPFVVLEPRAVNAINHLIADPLEPFKGRVDPMTVLLVSDFDDTEAWVSQYVQDHRESRNIIPFASGPLTAGESAASLVSLHMREHGFASDRFKHTLPLQEDTYFFGRTRELGRLVDLLRRGENAGLFGLRKTGKTSLVMKLKRAMEVDGKHHVEIIDGQDPAVRRRRWHELLHHIAITLNRTVSLPPPPQWNETDASDGFKSTVDAFLSHANYERLTLAFDEIEWISPDTCKNPHWNDDYFDFWHVIRAYQTRTRRLGIVAIGVNPAVSEANRYGNHQNPLFGITTPVYLANLNETECAEMVARIGKIMGLLFPPDSLSYLNGRYAGHPLLTRLACSHVSQAAGLNRETLPLSVSRTKLVRDQRLRDTELAYYVDHVVAELATFDPDAYSLLELLATDDLESFKTAAAKGRTAQRLTKFGIVVDDGHPHIPCEAVRDYVAAENARRCGRLVPYHVVVLGDRERFVASRVASIIEDMRELERIARAQALPTLFGPNSFPEADRLLKIDVPSTQNSFEQHLTVLQRCFIDSIENHGKHVGQKDYFWSTVRNTYPVLHEALERIKVYRNNAQHLELVDKVEQRLAFFLDRDLGNEPVGGAERYWILFQRCLNELFRAIQRETVSRRAA